MIPRGAVACGHPATAAAAQEVLEDGGNAFDAVLAAFAAANVVEPVFTSLGGGGFLLAQPAEGSPVLYDFFAETPRRRLAPGDIDFYPILADFGTATQEFHIGLGAMATPGSIKGLFAVHRDLARLPMARLLEPAIRLAREGVALRAADAYLFQVIGPILRARPEARALYCNQKGTPLGAGEVMVQRDQAAALEALAREGDDLFYRGDLGQTLLQLCRDEGGLLTRKDLEAYQVVKRRPLERRYRGARILTNPPPSAGGILIAFALQLLNPEGPAPPAAATPEFISLLGRVMDLTNKARIECRLHEAFGEAEETAAAQRLFDPALLEAYRQQVQGRPAALRGTTHISVIDGAGNLAAMTLSNGEGCGTLLPGSGIMLNNMLGEEDLNPAGLNNWPEACRMASMMAPTLAFMEDGQIAALGSGGSNRIRTAILQVLLRLIDFGDDVETAVTAPRLHYENGVANLEAGLPSGTADLLRPLAREIIDWPSHNLFFGGVHAVTRGTDGTFQAAGDPRRGGVAQVI